MDIEIVLIRLYESQIDYSISSFSDCGWHVKLGAEMNSFVAEGNFETLEDAAIFQARIHFPESLYALGPTEHAKREAIRLKAEQGKRN